ncbi:hypothetical protein AOT96_32695 (plasmid) [Rhodococcus sp. 008]|jgi:hypothetical protein|nr:hypothetical protein AOT96_32695 [Rhodococcus sp. 008]
MRDRQQLALGLSDHLFCEELVARVIDLPTLLSAGGLLPARESRIVAFEWMSAVRTKEKAS